MEIEEEGASISSSVLNLLNNVVGAGLFSLPWCLKEATVVTGSILVTFMCVLNITSFMLLADSCDLTKKYSYLELGRFAFGPFFGTVAQITTICYAAGSLISYSVLAGDCLAGKGTGILSLFFGENSILGDGSLTARAISIYSLSLIFFLPLSLLRRIDSLKYASIFAFAATLFAGFLVANEFIENPPNSREDDSNDESLASSVVWAGFPLGVWEAVPIVNVAFTAHYNGPRFYQELAHRTMGRFHQVIAISLGAALLIYLSVGVCGYLTFGEETLGDVLSNFSPTYKLAVGARAALLVILVAVFPKALHSMRDGVIRLSYGSGEVPMDGDTLPLQPYVLITCSIVFVAATLGAVCTQIEVVLAYKGGIFGTLMVYILPPLMRTAIAEITLAKMTYGVLAGGSGDSRNNSQNVQSQKKKEYLNVLQDQDDIDSQSMNSSLISSQDQNHEGYSSASDSKLYGAQTPENVIAIIKVMYLKPREHWKCAFLFTWGFGSGLLSVCVTILKQAGVLNS